MISNYLLIAWRNLWKRKFYAGINIFGLSLGLSACMLIFAVVWHIKSFDTYHAHADHTYRIVTNTFEGPREYHTPGVPAVMREAFVNDFDGVEASVLISAGHTGLISIVEGEREQYFQETNVTFTSDEFFEVFDRAILKGSNSNLLNEPNQAVISKKYAEKLFGTVDVLGRTFRFQKGDEFAIRGVMEDFPDNTDFPFDIFLSYENLRESRESGGWFSIHSDDQFYVVVKDLMAKQDIEAGLGDFVEKYIGEKNRAQRSHAMQPLSELHFDDRYSNYSYRVTSYTVINTMLMVAIFLLLTASINFINLSTALSGKRSKEVGLRKVFGGNRGHIISQFMSETGIICFVSLCLSFIIVSVSIQYFNDYLDIQSEISVFWSPVGIAAVLALWLCITVISGFYPSFNISKLNPVSAIKSQFETKNSSSYLLRKGLVIFQFMITQFFIMGTIILVMQMNHLRSADLGFRHDAVVTFDIPEENTDKAKLLTERLRNLSGIESLSISFTEPASSSSSATNAVLTESGEEYTVQVKPADEFYLATYGLDLLYGENLIKEDTVSRYLVTESFAKKAGFDNPEDMVGVFVKVWGREAPISGVIRDFYTGSLKSEIEPTFIFQRPMQYRTVGVNISGANANMVMSEAEKVFSNLYPEYSFQYSFLDEKIAQFYENEHKLTILFIFFSIIAVLVGCIGLYGLVSFVAAMKVKEIGVRKVLGASSPQVLALLSKEFLILIIAAFVIAAPLATFMMEQWLSNYASKISISWQVYAMALGIVTIIALITGGYRSILAAWSNPIKALNRE